MNPLPSVPDSLVRLIGSGSDSALLSIAEALESEELELNAVTGEIALLDHVDQELAQTAYLVFESIKDATNETVVASAIATAVGVRSKERLKSAEIEICWTGPESESDDVLVTPTAAAIDNLLLNCPPGGDILLVGYSLTTAEGTFMAEVQDQLAVASRNRSLVRVVLHQDDHENNRRQLLKGWDVKAREPEIYTWDPPDDHPYTKLHAKCLVVDRREMLVTSANFTFHGLESNIELGLLVRNRPLATAVVERFDHLIADRTLRRWESE